MGENKVRFPKQTVALTVYEHQFDLIECFQDITVNWKMGSNDSQRGAWIVEVPSR